MRGGYTIRLGLPFSMHICLTSKNQLKKLLWVVALFYGLYLSKTMLGINLSKNHSAHWLFKTPLHPIEASKDHLCQEMQVACIKRKQIRRKLRKGIRRVVS